MLAEVGKDEPGQKKERVNTNQANLSKQALTSE